MWRGKVDPGSWSVCLLRCLRKACAGVGLPQLQLEHRPCCSRLCRSLNAPNTLVGLGDIVPNDLEVRSLCMHAARGW